MIRLPKTLNAWGSSSFRDILKREVERLDAGLLPLQQGLSAGNYVVDGGFSVILLGTSEDEGFVHAKAGIFYHSVIAGCSCADDPTPIDRLNEYCEVQVDIDKRTAQASVRLLADPAGSR